MPFFIREFVPINVSRRISLKSVKYALLPLCFRYWWNSPQPPPPCFVILGHFTKFVRWSRGAIEGVTICAEIPYFLETFKYLTFSLHFLFFSVEKWLCFSNCKYKSLPTLPFWTFHVILYHRNCYGNWDR